MKKNFVILIFVIILLVALGTGILFYFSNKKQTTKKINYNIKQVIYQFHDSSVPPKYHRSYEIVANSESVILEIDSYGEILYKKEFSIENSDFEEVIKSIKKYNIHNKNFEENLECTGGTAETIIYETSNSKFKGTIKHCGGNDSGNLAGNVSKFAEDMQDLIPKFSKKLQETKKD